MLTAKKTAPNLYDAANAALETAEREISEFRDQRRGVGQRARAAHHM
jgi:hypothetical protein